MKYAFISQKISKGTKRKFSFKKDNVRIKTEKKSMEQKPINAYTTKRITVKY